MTGVHTNDTSRQLKYTNTIIQQIASSAPLYSVGNPSTPEPPPPNLRNEPICFIADTDSITYAVDSGVNIIILNNSHYMSNMQIIKGSINGIGCKGIQMSGSGDHSLLLKSDDRDFDTIPNLPTVYIPTSPYDLIPPQPLIKYMRGIVYTITDFSHDDKYYKYGKARRKQ